MEGKTSDAERHGKGTMKISRSDLIALTVGLLFIATPIILFTVNGLSETINYIFMR